MAYIGTTQTPFKKLYIKGNYKNFNEFYDLNKNLIYSNIIEVLKGFTTSKKRKLTLYIQAIILGIEWDHEFLFEPQGGYKLLNDTILPYFEQIENYEKCNEILSILDLLNKKNNCTI
jgi:hypothetical protein